jgi:hypothetical protein
VKEQSVTLKRAHRAELDDEIEEDEQFTKQLGNFIISHSEAYENDNSFWKHVLDLNFTDNEVVTIEFENFILFETYSVDFWSNVKILICFRIWFHNKMTFFFGCCGRCYFDLPKIHM